MTTSTLLLHSIDDTTLDRNERAQRRCALAKELEEQGNYHAARTALGPLWVVDDRSHLDALNDSLKAEVILRTGVLTGWLGSANENGDSQEQAKNLLTEASERFERSLLLHKTAEARTEIAWCYWREGAYKEARAFLQDALGLLDGCGGDGAIRHNSACDELRLIALLRSAIIDRMEQRLHDALETLNLAAPLLDKIGNDLLKGNFFTARGIILKNLGQNERRNELNDRAYIDYAAASFHYEKAGHTRYRASVENNLGLLLLANKRLREAQTHIERARKLALSLRDRYHTAQFEDSLAQVYLAQNRLADAAKASRASVRRLECGDEQATLAESLTTLGRIMGRQGNLEAAHATLTRAIAAAETIGAHENAGRACLTLIEELGQTFTEHQLRQIFKKVEEFLAQTEHAETKDRMLACAKLVINFEERAAQGQKSLSSERRLEFIHAEQSTGKLLRYAERVAATQGAVLISGETGTGKEVLAKLIHLWSGRRGRLVTLNCAALSEQLIESQLFGHRRGSFTDAHEDYPGAVKEAAGGTLFLDEIGDLPFRLQAKLLRLVEYREIHPLGAPSAECVDVRIIAATNKDLRSLVERKLFREDLYYRLQTFQLHLEPLRNRPADIAAIARHLLADPIVTKGKRVELTTEAYAVLSRLPLPGNVRELKSIIERTVLCAGDRQHISADDVEVLQLRQETTKGNLAQPLAALSLTQEVRSYEEKLIAHALNESGGNIMAAAKKLGISHQSLSFILDGRHNKLRAKHCAPKRLKSLIASPSAAATDGGIR